jgi:halimadienyl-diphosphate synthase
MESIFMQQIEQMAQNMIQESLSDPRGDVSPSIYETACVITFLPAPSRKPESINYLLQQQCSEGSWRQPGIPCEYALVPTLAATLCFLHLSFQAASGEPVPIACHALGQAARRGLGFLSTLFAKHLVLPDTVAIELILPAFVEEITTRQEALVALNQQHSEHLSAPLWQELRPCLTMRLPMPSRDQLDSLHTAISQRKSVPEKASHLLEFLGSLQGYGLPAFEADGIFALSPAATAALIARSTRLREPFLAGLEHLALRGRGTFPAFCPFPFFERALATFSLLKAGLSLPFSQKQAMGVYLQACIRPGGVGPAECFLPDGDDTGLVLTVLSELGVTCDLAPLRCYEEALGFRCYEREQTASVSTNAHILEALNSSLARTSSSKETVWIQKAAEKCTSYLLTQQRTNGTWGDKWHASPYYATSCSVQALQYSRSKETIAARDRAIEWVLQTQREDGSWGIWFGTLEKTAYALTILAQAKLDVHPERINQRKEQGRQFLIQHLDASAEDRVRTPLWHDKELYEPRRVTRAAVLGALYQNTRELETGEHLCASQGVRKR